MAIDIRPLRECDLAEADRIFRTAFGTFVGLPDPLDFAKGADIIGPRWRAQAHNATFGAFDGERLIGSNIATRWGSFGLFGPLTVLPEYWNSGIAQQLLEPTMEAFARWGISHAGLFTFPDSPKHLGLYQKFDFWPQCLTAIMAKPASLCEAASDPFEGSREDLLSGARIIAEAVLPGLDLGEEILALLDQGLGEIVTVCDGSCLVAFAILHIGANSEAGPDTALIKFAAARPGAAEDYAKLIQACETAAARRGMGSLVAGVNMACSEAYRVTLRSGFRIQRTGVAMQRRNDPGFLRADSFVVGDWR